MSAPSITTWLAQLKAGDADAAQALWQRYFARLVELARVLAGPFNFLLLDEPSSGLDATETHGFGEILMKVVAQRDAGILLVEHDMALVRQVCSHIYILDFGSLIFEGSPSEMLASEAVRTAYLGTELHDQDVEQAT